MNGVDQVIEIIEDAGRETAVDEHAIDEKLENLAQQIRVDEEKKEDQETQETCNDRCPLYLGSVQRFANHRYSIVGTIIVYWPVERGDSLLTESTDAFLQMSLNEKKEPCLKSDRTQRRWAEVDPDPIADG